MARRETDRPDRGEPRDCNSRQSVPASNFSFSAVNSTTSFFNQRTSGRGFILQLGFAQGRVIITANVIERHRPGVSSLVTASCNKQTTWLGFVRRYSIARRMRARCRIAPVRQETVTPHRDSRRPRVSVKLEEKFVGEEHRDYFARH